MVEREDGEPAFPRPMVRIGYDDYKQQDGMSLRDYFAGMALQGILAAWEALHFDVRPEAVSRKAYENADAMLEARKK